MLLKVLLAAALFVSTEAHYYYRYALPMHPHWPRQRDWNRLKERIDGGVVIRGEDEYSVDGMYYNSRTNNPQPAAIATPNTVSEVRCLMRFARRHRMRVSVISTGHHTDMRSTADNSLMIYMKNMKDMSIDHNAKELTVGPGNNFQDVHAFVKAQTNSTFVQLTGADYTVGPFGWALGGGHGMLGRKYGLGADAIRAATIVLASGRVLKINDCRHEELFRAIRGGGGNAFGVLTSLTFQLFPDPGAVHAWWGAYAIGDEVTEKYSAWLASAPDHAGAYWVPSNAGSVVIFASCFGDDCTDVIAELAAIPGCLASNSAFCNSALVFPDYPTYVNAFPQINARGAKQYWMAGATLAEDLDEQLKLVNKWIMTPEDVPVTKACYANGIVGGASKFMDPHGEKTAVAQAMRDSVQAITCALVWNNLTPEQEKDLIATGDVFSETVLKPFSPQGWVYWNEAQHNFPQNDWRERYWGGLDNYLRLRAVKLRYDPWNFLTCHHCVGWQFDEEVDPAVCPESGCSCSNTPRGECATYA
eukprot:TRINITY_DN16730_c0_g1_i1.p1 TRINITY_DN16730_c0_g1~~TRINITY_DN16730_c0_g1_i1.p1  ORF type:complete len:530 (+),score=127.96 TRINITY_DN16730_c0_g1_i1:46-1635(+)